MIVMTNRSDKNKEEGNTEASSVESGIKGTAYDELRAFVLSLTAIQSTSMIATWMEEIASSEKKGLHLKFEHGHIVSEPENITHNTNERNVK